MLERPNCEHNEIDQYFTSFSKLEFEEHSKGCYSAPDMLITPSTCCSDIIPDAMDDELMMFINQCQTEEICAKVSKKVDSQEEQLLTKAKL